MPLPGLVPTSVNPRAATDLPSGLWASPRLFLTYSWVIAPGRQTESLNLNVCCARQRGHCQKSTAREGARMARPALPVLQPAAALTAPLPRRLSGYRANSCLCSLLVFPFLVSKLFVVSLKCHTCGSSPLIAQAAWLVSKELTGNIVGFGAWCPVRYNPQVTTCKHSRISCLMIKLFKYQKA